MARRTRWVERNEAFEVFRSFNSLFKAIPKALEVILHERFCLDEYGSILEMEPRNAQEGEQFSSSHNSVP